MVLKKIGVAFISSVIGFVAGETVATLAIAVINNLATDGPLFPAPLVALLISVPITLFLLVAQGVVVAIELIARKPVGNALLPVGLVAGAAAGLSLYAVLVAPYGAHPATLPGLAGLGAFQGSLVFACHWTAYKSKISG